MSQDSDDSDSVFLEQASVASRRASHDSSPRRRQPSFRNHHERSSRSRPSRRSVTGEPRVEEEEDDDFDEDDYEQDQRERRRPRCHRQNSDRDWRVGEVRDRKCSRSESARCSRDLARTWSCRESSDKHVRFREGDAAGSLDAHPGGQGRVWMMLGQVLRERGVPVRIGGNGAPLQIWPQSRDGSEAPRGDSQPHQRLFRRASAARHSFHGDERQRRRPSYPESSGTGGGEGRDRQSYTEFHQAGGRSRDRRGSGGRTEGGSNDHGVPWTTGGKRRQWQQAVEEGLSSEEEQQEDEEETRVERRSSRRAPQRSHSLSSRSGGSARNRRRWPRVAAGN